MDVVLLHNAGAGDEDHSEEKLIRLLKRHGYRTTYAEVAAGLRDKKLIQRSDLVVAAGGDGTVRKTITQLADYDCPLAILPLGTANNIARSLGIGTDLDEVVAGWKTAQPRRIDLGLAQGPWGRTRFIEGVGLGLISRTIAILDELDERVASEFSDAKAKLHRDICVLAALAHEMPPVAARLSLPRRKIAGEFLLLEILNINRAGPGIVLAPKADPGDGRLNIVSVLAADRERLIDQIERHAGGRRPTRLHEAMAEELTLAVDPCALRIDDKLVLKPSDFARLPGRRAKIRIKVSRGAVTVLCPDRVS